MSTQILALLDNERSADKAAKALEKLNYDDLEWEFLSSDDSDVRIMPGLTSRTSADMADPVGFVQESDPPAAFNLDDLDLDDAERDYFARRLDGNAIVIKIDAPDEALDQVERVLNEHNASRYTEA